MTNTIDTIRWVDDHVQIIDQTLLQGRFEHLPIRHLSPDTSRSLLRHVVDAIPAERIYVCGSALANGMITAKELIHAGVKRDLAQLIGKYV